MTFQAIKVVTRYIDWLNNYYLTEVALLDNWGRQQNYQMIFELLGKR